MGYVYYVRGWMELSWPDAEFEGVDESAEEHTAKVQRVRELVTSPLTAEQAQDEATPAEERYKAGWGFPQQTVGYSDYLFYGGDIEDPAKMLEQIKAILAIDPFADGYFSLEGEDGEQYRQWIIKSGKVYMRRLLFPDFDSEDAPQGYSLLFRATASS